MGRNEKSNLSEIWKIIKLSVIQSLLNDSIVNEVVFSGREGKIKDSKIEQFTLNLPPKEMGSLLTVKRTLVLVNSSIKKLIIVDGGRPVDFKFTNSLVEVVTK